MFWPRYTVKKMFLFPRGFGKRDWSRINRGPLTHAGLLARKIERQMIRKDITKKQTPSKPGRPPKSRAPGHPFRRIFSDVNLLHTNVMIGHENETGANQTPMEIQEFGQMVAIKKIVPRKGRKIRDPVERARVRQLFVSGRIKSKPLTTIRRTIRMPARPFAYPTTVIVARRLPKIWQNSVTKGVVKNG